MTQVIFTSCSISSGLKVWSVNHNSVYENSELNVLKKHNILRRKYFVIDQTIY